MTAVGQKITEPLYCTDEDLPVNPFRALRVAYGMLLGEDDFRTLMGNPRGKLMLHNGWLHGSGVVRGFGVSRDEDGKLRVKPGLAIDGLGRELLLEEDWCRSVEAVLGEARSKGGERTVKGCLVAYFHPCPNSPVPALSDPCDLSRKHTDLSRVQESVRLEIRYPECPPYPVPGPYHRLRVLFGLDPVGDPDPAGDEAYREATAIATKPAHERAPALLEAFRKFAALDVIDIEPGKEVGDVCPSLFPVVQDDAPVALADVTLRLRGTADCTEVLDVEIDQTVRRSLVATGTIQELTCGLAPAVRGHQTQEDAKGPRVKPDTLEWDSEESVLTFEVDSALLEASLKHRHEDQRPVLVTTLTDRGWVRGLIDDISFDQSANTVKVVLHDPPYGLVRVIARGTGPTPIYGKNKVPLAGLVGGSPGSKHNGHDAVLTKTIEREAAQ